jgi:hypothetical protein
MAELISLQYTVFNAWFEFQIAVWLSNCATGLSMDVYMQNMLHFKEEVLLRVERGLRKTRQKIRLDHVYVERKGILGKVRLHSECCYRIHNFVIIENVLK